MIASGMGQPRINKHFLASTLVPCALAFIFLSLVSPLAVSHGPIAKFDSVRSVGLAAEAVRGPATSHRGTKIVAKNRALFELKNLFANVSIEDGRGWIAPLNRGSTNSDFDLPSAHFDQFIALQGAPRAPPSAA